MAEFSVQDLDAVIAALQDYITKVTAFSTATDLSSVNPSAITTAADLGKALDAFNNVFSLFDQVDASAQTVSNLATDSLSTLNDMTLSAANQLQKATGLNVSTNCAVGDQYQGIRFYDGTAFGYLRIFADKVQLLVDQPYEFALDGTLPHVYRIVAQGEDINLYVDGQIAITATGSFTQPTASKLIEFGDIAGRNQIVGSDWYTFRYTTTGAYPPANTEDLLLEETITFADASVGRMKTYDKALYCSVDPANPDLSSTVYRYEEGKGQDHRPVLAITQSNINAVVVDPNRLTDVFGSSGKFLATDNGLQYAIGSKPFPFDFVTSFAKPIVDSGWRLDQNCTGPVETLADGTLTIDTTGEPPGAQYYKYKQDFISDSWVANADNKIGWTVEVRVKVDDDGTGDSLDLKSSFLKDTNKDCGQTTATAGGDVPPEDNLVAPGIYLNDGTYQEIVQFFAKGIRLKYAKLFGDQVLTDRFYTVRILGRGTAIAVYVKGDGDNGFTRLIFSPNAFTTKAHPVAAQERPSVVTDSAGLVHVVWQEPSVDGISIFYNRMNRTIVVDGNGIIGKSVFDPNDNPLDVRVGLGLAPVTVDWSSLDQNNLVSPMASFVSKGVKAGDILQIFFTDGSRRKYRINNVLSEVLLELDTPDDLTGVGPAGWAIIRGQPVWGRPARISPNLFDSQNPVIISHSNGALYVAYDNNEGGGSQIHIAKGLVTATGMSWTKTLQVTNSSHNAKFPGLAQLASGDIVVVWEDSSNDMTGSQVFYASVDKDLAGVKNPQVPSITPSALHAIKPRVAANHNWGGAAPFTDQKNVVAVVYEDDVSGQSQIYAALAQEDTSGKLTFTSPRLVNDPATTCTNPTITSSPTGSFECAYETAVSGGRTAITVASIGSSTGKAADWTSASMPFSTSVGNCRHPMITTDLAGNPAVVFESNRTREEFYELYVARFGSRHMPTGLAFDSSTGLLSGTPLETGTFDILLAAYNGKGAGFATLSLDIQATGTPGLGSTVADPGGLINPFITSPRSAIAVLNQTFSYQTTATNSPSYYGFSRTIGVSNDTNGLDLKLKTYLTTNEHPSIAYDDSGELVVVFESTHDDLPSSVTGLVHNGVAGIDNTVLGYFPLNDTTSDPVVKNRILYTDPSGTVSEPMNGVAFQSPTDYAADPIPGVSLFGPENDGAFDLHGTYFGGYRGGFSVGTDLVRKSGAIDMYVKPYWPSNDAGYHVFFGNGPLVGAPGELLDAPLSVITPDSMVLGVGPASSGNMMVFRVIDSAGEIHETRIANPTFWNGIDQVAHIRAIWDSTNIGVQSINSVSFVSSTLGFACGPNGQIVKTSDGGQTWTKLPTGITYDLYSIDFFDATTGFACGEYGTVLTTTDAGATWTAQAAGVTVDLKSIYFKDALVGYACGANGTVLRSGDGGVSWGAATIAETSDLNGLAMVGTDVIAVSKSGKIYSSNDDGVTYAEITGLPKASPWNAISRARPAPSDAYVVGNTGSILYYDGATWTDLSTGGPDVIIPNLQCVTVDAGTVWVPWGKNKLAYKAPADTEFTFVNSSLAGPYKSASVVGSTILVTGAGGRLVIASGLGATQDIYNTGCSSLSILVNGIEVDQTKVGDCSFAWAPTSLSNLFFGDYRQDGRPVVGDPGDCSADTVMDEVVIYGVPTPGHSAYIHHEFNVAQTEPVPLVSSDMAKRIEWGSLSPLVKTKTEWKDFRMFYCGSKEPVQTFLWDTRVGLVDDVVLDMAKDQNGHLWLATQNGISRFDMNVGSSSIDAFLSGRDQPIIGSEGLFLNYTNMANGLVSDTVNSITVDSNGDVWAGTSKGLMLLSLSGNSTSDVDPTLTSTVTTLDQFTSFTTADGLPSNNIKVVRAVTNGLFIGTDKGLAVVARAAVDRTSATPTTTTTLGTVSTFTVADGLPSNNIQAIAQEPDGPVWVGTERGLAQFNGKKILVYGTNNGLISRNIVSVTVDKSGKKYIGTGFGLTTIQGSDFQNYPPSTGIGSGAIRGGDQDGTGIMWFATASGLVEMDTACGIRFSTISSAEGIVGDPRIVDYQRYRILGDPIPAGGCEKALVTVAVNGKQLSTGFIVDPYVPWVVFDEPLGPSDTVDVCVKYGWRKVHDFTFDKNNNEVTQASVETEKSTYLLYRKRFQAGTVSLGACFADGAQNTSTKQYAVFAAPLTGDSIPISSVVKPATAELMSTTELDESIYSDITEKITGLPQEVLGTQRIALASTESDEIETDYLDFVLNVDSIVYVAYDSRSQALPAWLRAFTPVPVVARVTDMETFTDATNQEKLFVSTSGTNGCVYDILHDPTVCDISDQIAIDVTPPEGCATITKVNSKSSLTLALQATDAVTGVASMQISPREDGTTDGTTPVPFIPYANSYIFTLPASATSTTGDVADIPDDTVPGGTVVPPPTDIINNVFHDYLGTLLIGTVSPGRVYKFDRATQAMTLLFDTGEDQVLCMTTYGNDLIVGTGNNGKTFRWNGTSLIQLPQAIGNKVMSAWVFANQIFLGYWPGGEIYTVDQFGAMSQFKNTNETGITDFATYGGSLYWSSMNETASEGQTLATTTKKGHKHFVTVPAGITMLTDLNVTTTIADGHSHSVVNGVVQPAQSHIHGVNGFASGKIFRYDPASGQPIIVHSDPDYAVMSLGATGVDSASGILFAGTSPNGKVLRLVPDEQLFVKSFQTAKMTVNKLRYYTKMYAMADDTVYGFTGKHWEYVASVSGSAHDIAPEAETSTSTTGTGILVLKDDKVASTSAAPQTLNPTVCAYVRFKDVAGNISDIRDTSGALVACYSPCIDLSTDSTTGGTTGGTGGTPNTTGLVIGKNRLMEIDEDAKVVFSLDGTEAFFSGNKVEEEVAVYYSEIFNGTNSFVQWTNLSWVAVLPDGTSVTMAVRNADTSSGITSAAWSDEYSENQSYPIGSGIDITSLTGQFLQFKATLRATTKGVSSPVLQKVDIGLRTSQAVHYFTTNFSLPDNLKQVFLTYNGCNVPPVTDIVFGVTGLDSTDFSDYYVLSPDKVVDLPSEQQTKNLRVGIKLISSPTDVPIVDEFAILVSLANDAMVRINQSVQPVVPTGQLVSTGSTRTVTTELVQGHVHSVTFDSSILDKADINGQTSVAAGHLHSIISGVVQIAAGHQHLLTI